MNTRTATGIGRSDAEIFADTRRRLDRRTDIPETVWVHVEDGVVTLAGDVRVGAERDSAGNLARRVNGVHRVINNIVVANPEPAGSRIARRAHVTP